MALVAGLAWLVVAGYGLREVMNTDDTSWQLAYGVFSIALLVGAVLTVAAGAVITGGSDRPRLRIAGLIVGGLGCALAVVAWALPVWMTLLGVGFAVVAVAAGPAPRRALALLAAAQLIGVLVLIVAIEAEVGAPDEYGDYPVAAGTAVMFVAVVTIVALITLTRSGRRPAVVGSESGLELGVGGVG